MSFFLSIIIKSSWPSSSSLLTIISDVTPGTGFSLAPKICVKIILSARNKESAKSSQKSFVLENKWGWKITMILSWLKFFAALIVAAISVGWCA